MAVADTMQAEITRFSRRELLPVSRRSVDFRTMEDIFGSVRVFFDVPIVFFVLPAQGDWSVLWNNSYLLPDRSGFASG